jgi:hypothetical protein
MDNGDEFIKTGAIVWSLSLILLRRGILKGRSVYLHTSTQMDGI